MSNMSSGGGGGVDKKLFEAIFMQTFKQLMSSGKMSKEEAAREALLQANQRASAASTTTNPITATAATNTTATTSSSIGTPTAILNATASSSPSLNNSGAFVSAMDIHGSGGENSGSGGFVISSTSSTVASVFSEQLKSPAGANVSAMDTYSSGTHDKSDNDDGGGGDDGSRILNNFEQIVQLFLQTDKSSVKSRFAEFLSPANSEKLFPVSSERASHPCWRSFACYLVPVDIEHVHQFMQSFAKGTKESTDVFVDCLKDALANSNSSLTSEPIRHQLKLLLIGLQLPNLDNFELMKVIVRTINNLPIEGKSILSNYVAVVYTQENYVNLLDALANYITISRISQGYSDPKMNDVRKCVKVLAIFAVLQSTCFPGIPCTKLVHDFLCDEYFKSPDQELARRNFAGEFHLWQQESQKRIFNNKGSNGSSGGGGGSILLGTLDRAGSRELSPRGTVSSISSSSGGSSGGGGGGGADAFIPGGEGGEPMAIRDKTGSSSHQVLGGSEKRLSALSYRRHCSESSTKTCKRTLPGCELMFCDCNDCLTLEDFSLKGLLDSRGINLACESFFSFPFLLTTAIKSDILETESQLAMRQEMRAFVQQHGLYQASDMYFLLHVRRSSIVQDTLGQIEIRDPKDFRRQLKVIFDNEEGVDAGGVRKEYFMVMMRELLDPQFGMFVSNEESRLRWFNSASLESTKEFELVGTLVAIAMYNTTIIDLKMPKSLFKKLKSRKCGLSDLAELQPALAKGLKQLRDFEGDVAATFDFRFQISYDFFGEIKTYDLIENGGDVVVTNENRDKYIEHYVRYLMETSIENQFNAFRKGFMKVMEKNNLNLFEPDELELVICGNPSLDFDDLEKGARYDDGYSKNSTTIKMFWRIVKAFTEDMKRVFLKFLTGSDRTPVQGLDSLQLVVSRMGSEDNRLPSAHTCFNHLLLPQYSTEAIMRERLIFAIENQSEGFGLR